MRLPMQEIPANAGDLGSIPGLGRSPGERTATHSSLPAWEIPCTREPDELQSMGWQSYTRLNDQQQFMALLKMGLYLEEFTF